MAVRIQAYGTAQYRQIWRIVDGAIADCFAARPDYLTKTGKKWARQSIAKRIVGQLCGYVSEVAESEARGRFAGSATVEMGASSNLAGVGVHSAVAFPAGRAANAPRTLSLLGIS